MKKLDKKYILECYKIAFQRGEKHRLVSAQKMREAALIVKEHFKQKENIMITQLKTGWVRLKNVGSNHIRNESNELFISCNVSGKRKSTSGISHIVRVGIPHEIANTCGFLDGDHLVCDFNPREGEMRICRSSRGDGYKLRRTRKSNKSREKSNRYVVCFPLPSVIRELVFPNYPEENGYQIENSIYGAGEIEFTAGRGPYRKTDEELTGSDLKP